MTSGIEPTTFRMVAEYLNQLRWTEDKILLMSVLGGGDWLAACFSRFTLRRNSRYPWAGWREHPYQDRTLVVEHAAKSLY
jgi:hypothetical protein